MGTGEMVDCVMCDEHGAAYCVDCVHWLMTGKRSLEEKLLEVK